jgi:hypothetical protein
MQEDAKDGPSLDTNKGQPINTAHTPLFRLSSTVAAATVPTSTWPVILTIYNLLTWLYHKRKYLMLSILIQGPKQAGTDIDVLLEALMEDMEKLCNEWVRMWDQYQQEYFTLYAIIFVCIHDAPGGFTLSGQTKGKSGACPVCVDGTASVYFPSSRKLVYM